MDLLFADKFQKALFETAKGALVYASFNGGSHRLVLKVRYPGRSILTLTFSQDEAREMYKRIKPAGEVDFRHQPGPVYPHISSGIAQKEKTR